MILNSRPPSNEQRMLPLSLITERLPIRRLHAAGVTRLRKSMQRAGFLENFPLLVMALNEGTFQLLDGIHRYEAAMLEGLACVPCIVKANLTVQERFVRGPSR